MPVVTAAGACHTCTVGGPVSWERRGLLTHVLCCTGIRSLCEHRHEPPAGIYRSPSLRYPASGPEAQRRAAVGAWGAPTPRFHVALDQGAGSVSLWLINVQFEVYYEPPGFNYCTIIQSIPCHFIFMAFVMPLYVRSPHSVLEEFPSSAGFHTVLLAGPDCRLFRPPVCAFHSEFFTDLTPYALFLSFSWDTAVFLSSETVL